MDGRISYVFDITLQQVVKVERFTSVCALPSFLPPTFKWSAGPADSPRCDFSEFPSNILGHSPFYNGHIVRLMTRWVSGTTCPITSVSLKKSDEREKAKVITGTSIHFMARFFNRIFWSPRGDRTCAESVKTAAIVSEISTRISPVEHEPVEFSFIDQPQITLLRVSLPFKRCVYKFEGLHW